MAIFYVELALAGDKRVPECRDMGPELFVGPDGEGRRDREYREAQAKAVCAGCQVRTECLIWALDHYERGVWGGTSDDDRYTIRTGRRMKDPTQVRTSAGRIAREERAWSLSLKGYTRHQIAKELGVTPDTVYDYLKSQRRVHDHEASSNATPDKTADRIEAVGS